MSRKRQKGNLTNWIFSQHLSEEKNLQGNVIGQRMAKSSKRPPERHFLEQPRVQTPGTENVLLTENRERYLT